MANQKSATNGTPKRTVAELRKWYEENKSAIERYTKAKDGADILRDVTQTVTPPSVQTINKEELKQWFNNIGANEKNLRKTARYLYYRSNIFYRLVNWYADMFELNCRKITPKYDLIKGTKEKEFLKSYSDTLDALDILNLQNNMLEALINVFVEDVYFGLILKDETGSFFYRLDPDECLIDGKYYTGNYSFSLDMSKWTSTKKQKIIEFIGEPLVSMYKEYQSTNVKYIHVPGEYSVCFKFRTDMVNLIVPPFVTLFLQIAALEDLVDIQADADALSIYKLIYLPLKVLSSTKESDDFQISPDIAADYFDRLLGAIPQNVAAGIVPGDKLEVIDFDNTNDKEVNSVETASNQILQTAGGGAVINSSKITSTAAFNAWLKAETEFAISPLLPQIEGFCNLQLSFMVGKPAKVTYFPISTYTKDDFREKMLESAQYGYSNRIAYGTLLNVSEREQLASIFLETEVLKLQDKMIYPLSSSFTSSGNGLTEDGYTPETGQGAPKKDDKDLTPEGERSRNR